MATTSAKLRGLLGTAAAATEDDDGVSVLSNETPPNIGLYEAVDAVEVAATVLVVDMTVLDEEETCDDDDDVDGG